ncbi:MAG: hypothetical protein K6T80_02050 [Firmicutes bacterium]|nr:hypothetical protein [Bacillota bacterium]
MSAVMIVTLIVLGLVVLSLRERVRHRLARDKDWSAIGETRASPLALAITNMIGVAGGIYLTLVVLVAFLELQVPARVQVAGLSLEPLAAVSFALAIVQPYMYRIIEAWRRF